MSSESPARAAPRLLPAAVESSLRDWALRSIGCVLIGFAVLAWIALLSWTVSDPSLTQATARPVRNLLGPLGAAASDLMVQTLGAAVVFVLIGPMVWGLELVAGARPIPRFGVKMLAFPVAVLALAGALSGLPTFAMWPLHNGFGGMLGDLIYHMSVTAVVGVSPERGSSMAGTGLGGVGMCLLLHALGFRLDHLTSMVLGRAAPADVAAEVAVASVAEPDGRVSPVLPMPAEPVVEVRAVETTLQPVQHVVQQPVQQPVQQVVAQPAQPIAAEDAAADCFDAETDAQARAVAERFAHKLAPKGKTATAKPAREKTAAKAAPRSVRAPVAEPAATPVAPQPVELQAGYPPARANGQWQRPSFELLARPSTARHGNALHLVDADTKAGVLVDVLADFGVSGAIRDIKPGPIVTRYEFEPARGVKTSRVIGLADDIARSLGVRSVRIAVVPGRNAIGVEVPNAERQPVLLREILESPAFQSSPAALPLALGRDIGGDPIVVDLASMPHLLIAGTTGSGKSVGVNAMILSLIYGLDPGQLRLLLIDPKMLELAAYNAIPHLLAPVVTDAHTAAAALDWAVGEMERRYQRMAKLGVRNIESFNARARRAQGSGQALVRTVQIGFDSATGQPMFEHEPIDGEPMPYIVIVVDEFADLMATAGDQVEASIQRLAQMARAAGIHLIMATQRPSVDVVTGTIKANFPMRISFRVASRTDSRTILNDAGAEQLLGHGDMLIASGSGQPLRVHGAFVSDDEIALVAQSFSGQSFGGQGGQVARAAPISRPAQVQALAQVHAQAQVRAPVPTSARGVGGAATRKQNDALDQIYDDAVAVVLADRKVSPGHLHRQLGITEAMAGELIARMQLDGLVGGLDQFGRRKILVASVAQVTAA